MKLPLLIVTILFTGSLMAQKTKTNTAKIDFTQYPSLPVEGMNKLGIQVYTADIPFNKDTLRLYLGNMDIMKSDVEQLSKVDFQGLNEVTIVGGEGDLTVDMAFGKPSIVSKKQKTTSCMVAKDGCTQYYYIVEYSLPTVLQAKNSNGIIDTWELSPEMELQFGNEQVESHINTEKGSITSISVINFTSESDLAIAFMNSGQSTLARKAIVKQIGAMAESIYERAFFEKKTLKLDIAYGTGSAADYEETETAAKNAIVALESKDYASLQGPIKVWESWLALYNSEDKKAAVNNKVAQGLHENLSIAYTFTSEFDKARNQLNKAIDLSQIGFVNENEVSKLKAFHQFIDQQEKVNIYNSALKLPPKLVTAPDIKEILGKRKHNKDINFLIAEDKYSALAKKRSENSPKKDISEMTINEFLNQATTGTTNSNEEISLEGRVENNMLILSGLIDVNMRGKALPSSICDYPEIKMIRARNIGLTSLPDCMNKLTDLEKLYINTNTFERLPDVFGTMKKLEVLDISDNNLKSLPASIFTLTNLKKMSISGNQLSEAELKKLKESLPNTKFN